MAKCDDEEDVIYTENSNMIREIPRKSILLLIRQNSEINT